MKYFILILLLISIIPFASSECQDNQIDINTASLEELDEIVWVGLKTAQKIIDARPYETLDDLIKVNGIGDFKLVNITEQNLACVEGEKIESVKEEIENAEEEIIKEETENIIEEENKDIIILKENKVITLNNVEKSIEDDLIYVSKSSKTNNYLSYAFSIFLIFIIVILIREKF